MPIAVRRAFLLGAIACAGCSTLAGPVSALNSDTWDASCKGAMREIVQPLTGESTVDCGFLALSASDRDFYDIMVCARSAIASGKAYRFGYQNADNFFGYCKVAARSPDGKLWSLEFYAPIDKVMDKVEPLQYSFNVKRCSNITIQNNRRGFFYLQSCTEATDSLMQSLHEGTGG